MRKLKQPEDIALLFEGLSKDLVDAHAYRMLWRDLTKALEREVSVCALAQTYWYMTFNALQQTWVAALCRLFDSEASSLSLEALLIAIREHLSGFEEPAFRRRLSKNPHLDMLSVSRKLPDLLQVDADIALCGKYDPAVSKLIKIRNHRIAHRSFTLTIKDPNGLNREVLFEKEVDALMERAKNVLNRYSHMFDASTYSTEIKGQHDYAEIIKAMKMRVRAIEIELGLTD